MPFRFRRSMALPTVIIVMLAVPGSGSRSQSASDEQPTGFLSGNRLLDICDQSHSALCIGYIAGIADAMGTSLADGSHPAVAGWQACFPQGVSGGQVRDVAINYLQAHPEQRQLSAASLVAHALSEAFPCKPR